MDPPAGTGEPSFGRRATRALAGRLARWRRALDPGDAAMVVVIAAALALYGVYLAHTSVLERNPDAGSHLAYVGYIVRNGALPSAGDCSVCHHPPVYYLLAAGVEALSEAAGCADPAIGLQILSLAIFMAFLAGSAFSVRRLVPAGPGRPMAMSLVAFWPSSVINSVRVNNDVLFYAIAAWVFLLALKWCQERSARPLWLACSLAVAGLFTKANALALVALIGVLVVVRSWRAPDRKALWRTAMPPVAILVLVAALHGFVRGETPSDLARNVLGTAYKTGPDERMPRTASYYLTFDLPSFVASPYVVTRQFRNREPTWWNHLLKSSLFGTRNVALAFSFPHPEPSGGIARILVTALLALFGVLAVGVLLAFRRRPPGLVPCVAAVGVWVVAGLGFHLLVPYSHHADFRFIFPVVVPLAALYALSVEGFRFRAARWAGRLLAVAFVALSIAYFVPATWSLPVGGSPV